MESECQTQTAAAVPPTAMITARLPESGPPADGLAPEVRRAATVAKPAPEQCSDEQLVEIVLGVARRFRAASDVVSEHRDYVLRLKAEVFKVRFGPEGIRAPIRWTDENGRTVERRQQEPAGAIEAFREGGPTAILLEPYLTFGGGGYGSGCRGRSGPTAEGYARTLRACHRLLSSTKAAITDLDWTEIDWASLGPDDFVFVDPPYLGADVRPYGESDIDHERLVCVLREAKFKWMLTEYPQEPYFREHRFRVTGLRPWAVENMGVPVSALDRPHNQENAIPSSDRRQGESPGESRASQGKIIMSIRKEDAGEKAFDIMACHVT